jgi:hypothetical protein
MLRSPRVLGLCAALGVSTAAVPASAVVITLNKLTGLVGTAPNAETAVYAANLGLLSGSFAAIAISDVSGGFGGSSGQFSGFDLDGIKLSTTNCATAACAAAAPGLALFNFATGIAFSPGTQRVPVDPKLFGTGPTGLTVNNAVATLGAFDALSSTVTPNGFVSLGDNGTIVFNLTALTSTAGLYLYLGEVGDNGEVAGSNVELRTTAVPEPETWGLITLGFGAMGHAMRSRRKVTRIRFA